MLTFSYTINPSLRKEIEKIDETRNKILLELISRRCELQLRWETVLDRITQGSRFTSKKLKRQEVLDDIDPRRNKSKGTENMSYLKTFEWVRQNWYLNSQTVEPQAVRKVLSFFGTSARLDEKQISDALDFIQVNPEHPIIQAALSFFLISQILPKDDNNIRLSIIISNIFMYKYGYDFRGLLNLEEFLLSDLAHFQELLSRAEKERNLSSYLEYFTQAVSISAEHAARKIAEGQFKNDLPSSFYDLSERRKEIMGMFDKPGVKISNKTIQKEFGVSQITASRDLAKLHALGLIFSAGKGRSVYYTKI
mgnify:CR=1 FL=1